MTDRKEDFQRLEQKKNALRLQLEPHGVLVLSYPQILQCRPKHRARLISIRDPAGDSFTPLPDTVRNLYTDVCEVEFHDIREVEGPMYRKHRDPSYRWMTAKDAEKILDFVSLDIGANYIIHCYAGVSRSSAVALMLAVVRKDSELFFKILTNDVFSPNPTVFRMLTKVWYDRTGFTPVLNIFDTVSKRKV